MQGADYADWSSPSPLWQPALPRALRRFPAHLRPRYEQPSDCVAPGYRSAALQYDWVCAIKTDYVWVIASPVLAAPVDSDTAEWPEDGPPVPPAGGSGRPRAWLQVVLVGSLCAVSFGTVAQELEGFLPTNLPIVGSASSVTVFDRPRPDFDAPGIEAGTFSIHPVLSEGLGFDSNPLGSGGQAGSAFVSTQANVSVVSDWVRNSLGASVSVDDRRYLQQTQLSHTDDTVSLGGRYDVGTADHLVLAATHSDLHIEPTGLDAISATQAVPYQLNGGSASYLLNFSRLSLEPFTTVNNFTYSSSRTNGVAQNNQYLNNTTVDEGVTARYELSPLRHAVFVVRSSESDFTNPTPGTPRRNSVGVSVLGGLDYVADGVWRYRALAGYQVREYASSTYKSHSAPIVEADVIWSPSQLTTVELTANRRIVDSNDPLVADYTDTMAKLELQHEVRRDVLVSAHASYEQALFESGGGQQTILNAGATATWLLNHNLKANATYNHAQSVSGTRSSYSDDTLLLGLTAGI